MSPLTVVPLRDKMYFRGLYFVLLGFCVGALNVSGQKPCVAPVLDTGFYVSVDEHIGTPGTYPDGTKINYSCDEGRKPNTEGWWGTSTCQNGIWTQTPRCIDVNDCLHPEIPNAESKHESYSNGATIQIKCDEGYEISGDTAATRCTDGDWERPLPVCRRDSYACSQPDEIPHAVIMHKYQIFFNNQKSVSYKCETGYSVAQGKRNSIKCTNGQWEEAECVKDAPPVTTSPPPVTQVTQRPSIARGADHGVSTQPSGSGPFLPIERCGKILDVENSIATPTATSVTYECVSLHKLVGSAVVVCHENGWSTLPTCRQAYCELPEAHYRVRFLDEGFSGWVQCQQLDTQRYPLIAKVECSENGRLQPITHCCVQCYTWNRQLACC